MSAPRFDDERVRSDATQAAPPVFAVVDNDPWLRRTLANGLLVAGLEVETHRRADTLLLAVGAPPDCGRALILDFRQPQERLELASQLRRRGIDLSVVVVGSPSEISRAVAAMWAGKMRTLQTPLSTKALIDRLREVLASSARERLPPSKSVGLEFLSRRERVVLRHLLAARSTSEIASALRVSLQSVVSCKRRLMEKFQARSELDLVLQVMGLKGAWS